MTFLDANVIIRYLTTDDAPKAARCERMFDRVARGRETVVTHVLTVAEVVWVLTGTYRIAKERVVDALVQLLSLERLILEEKELMLAALGMFKKQPIDFIDAYHAVWMQARRVAGLYSYDEDFDSVPNLKRVEP